jgi:gamma-glutamyltranspeptidase/glutathione hydrolase
MKLPLRSLTGLWLCLLGWLILFPCCNKPEKAFYQKSSLSKKAMVVSANRFATQVGLEILNAGGNAVDAAIAVHFALAVVYPRAGNIGGGGFMLFRDTNNEISALDFREIAPSKAFADMYLDEEGQALTTLSQEGGLAIAVPGSVAGMWAMYQKLSPVLSWEQLLAPAIRLAEEGFEISALEAERLNEHQQMFRQWNDVRCPFIKDGKWRQGDKIIQTALAGTLGQIAMRGQDAFYKGALAEALVKAIKNKKGIIEVGDLEKYQPLWRVPIKQGFQQYEIYAMPPPSSGGITLAQIAKILEQYSMVQEEPLNPYNIHLIAEAARSAFEDRAAFLGDPDFVKINTERLLSPKYLEAKMKDYNPNVARKSKVITSGGSKESYETTHFTIVDHEGRCVSITTTLNSNYGSKLWIPDVGCFMNSEMDDFSIMPGVPNQFGLIGSEANAIGPNKRPLSSMAPSIVTRNGELVLALGSPGGPTIISTVLQIILNTLYHNMELSEAVQIGRFHHQWVPDELLLEERIAPEIEADLNTKGHTTRRVKRIGSVSAVRRHQSGMLEGAADPRDESHAQGL